VDQLLGCDLQLDISQRCHYTTILISPPGHMHCDVPSLANLKGESSGFGLGIASHASTFCFHSATSAGRDSSNPRENASNTA
jgi:hypothetical protein